MVCVVCSCTTCHKELRIGSFKPRYVLCVVDATMWPSSTQYMMECVTFLQSVVSISGLHVGHVQLPLYHLATSMNTDLKNTRKLQMALFEGRHGHVYKRHLGAFQGGQPTGF